MLAGISTTRHNRNDIFRKITHDLLFCDCINSLIPGYLHDSGMRLYGSDCFNYATLCVR